MAHEDTDARTDRTTIRNVTQKELEDMIRSLEDGTMIEIFFAMEVDQDE